MNWQVFSRERAALPIPVRRWMELAGPSGSARSYSLHIGRQGQWNTSNSTERAGNIPQTLPSPSLAL